MRQNSTFLNSVNFSMNLIDFKTNEIKGIAFSVPWKKEDDYDIVNAKAKEWHDCAADIANEFSEDKRHLIWRDLQFQHIYDLGQQVLSNSKKPFVVYLAMLYFDKEVRSSQISYKVMSSYRNSEECKDCSFLVQGIEKSRILTFSKLCAQSRIYFYFCKTFKTRKYVLTRITNSNKLTVVR